MVPAKANWMWGTARYKYEVTRDARLKYRVYDRSLLPITEKVPHVNVKLNIETMWINMAQSPEGENGGEPTQKRSNWVPKMSSPFLVWCWRAHDSSASQHPQYQEPGEGEGVNWTIYGPQINSVGWQHTKRVENNKTKKKPWWVASTAPRPITG